MRDGIGNVAALRRCRAASADGSTLLLERTGPATLETVRAEDAAEVAGELARRLAVPTPIGTRSLASPAEPWLAQLELHALADPASRPGT
ncbi:hypothetical protein G3I59_20085 [Amycolatopsis rubida]|uniref:Uncharacterized protein n=1 Tax=Amycolatopsis rubida TaxID=112413 RepID=A0ABX0BYF5_9PSEU|nr:MULTISPECIES: hypothetical protein [Amycolatopsis]MYW92849.1 hypothetical protein [Amycolatopsis rubida]NEC57835.1 hypothetical protein [Amycolatopsis rubida]